MKGAHMRIIVTPEELFLKGNAHQDAILLLSEISMGIRAAFDAKTLKVEVKLARMPDRLVQLYLVGELGRSGWVSISFSGAGSDSTINMTAGITPEQKRKYID